MNSKLTPIQRREAQEMYKDGLSSREIASMFGVCQVAVLNLVNGRTYGGEYVCEVRPRGVQLGSKRGRYKDGGVSRVFDSVTCGGLFEADHRLEEVERLLEEATKFYGG